ncbi:MAG: radical SAM protein [Eubacteriales bacterium]
MKKSLNIAEYLSRSVKRIAAGALRTSLQNPQESAYILKFSTAARHAEKTRMQHEKAGRHIPAFLISSITAECNLDCKGCYAKVNQNCRENTLQDIMPEEKWNDIFSQARKLGVSFILLAGGEPLIRKNVIEYAADYPEIIFPVFTNGTMIDKDYLRLFDANRNLVPILSLEGERKHTDARRGAGVYERLTVVMDMFNKRGIFYGVSITVTTENIRHITDPAFIAELSRSGCKVIFFIEYVPVTEDSIALAPGNAERTFLDEQQNILRDLHPELMFLSFPGDEKYTGGCLAAGRGFFHINAYGGAEPCPFSPYSDINVRDHSLQEVLDSKLFVKLRESGMLIGEHRGGCLLFEKEEDVKNFLSE